ncbi:uncharacterized protein METZ01_LOCUS20161, partial [marine metagenome]
VKQQTGPPSVSDPRDGEHQPQPELGTHYKWCDQNRIDGPINIKIDYVD